MQTWSADVCKLRSTNSVPGTSKIIKKIAKQSAARRQIVGGGGGGAPTNKCRRRRRGENRGGGGAARPAQGSTYDQGDWIQTKAKPNLFEGQN